MSLNSKIEIDVQERQKATINLTQIFGKSSSLNLTLGKVLDKVIDFC